MRAREVVARHQDEAFAETMIAARHPLVAAAIHREDARTEMARARARIAPMMAALQDAVRATGGRPADWRRHGLAVIDIEAPVLLTPLDGDDAPGHERLAARLREDPDGLALVPVSGPVADAAGLGDQVDAACRAMSPAHAAYHAARGREAGVTALIDQMLDGLVAMAAAQLGPQPGPIETALAAFRVDFGGDPILGPSTPLGDHAGFRALMAQARPAEAVRALLTPRHWPGLLDRLDAHPILERTADIVNARSRPADLEISGSTDVRAIRRPGLRGATRFEAIRLGEQRSLTVPAGPEEDCLYAALRPGQILRVSERRGGAAGGDTRQVDLMVTAMPRRIRGPHLAEARIDALAESEGITAAAYGALLARRGGGIVVPIKVVAQRHVAGSNQQPDGSRERAKVAVRGRSL